MKQLKGLRSVWLIFILIVFALKGFYFIFLIPPWEAPDEPGHVAYVMYLYYQKSIPSAFKPFMSTSLNQSVIHEKLENTERKSFGPGNLFDRNDRRLSPVSANLASHPPLYYVYLLPFYRLSLFFSSYWTIILLRIGSLVIGVGCLILSYHIGKRLISARITLLSVLLMSLQPTFTFISAIVNSDIAVVFIFLLFIYMSIETLVGRKNNIPLAALIAGLGPLVKPQLIVLIPGYFILLFLTRNKQRVRNITLSIVSCLPIFLWTVFNSARDGMRFMNYAVQNIHPTNASLIRYPVDFILQKQYIGIFMSFWGYFGWLDVPMNKFVYLIYAFFLTIGLLGWIVKFKHNNYRVKLSPAFMFIFTLCLFYVASIWLFDIQFYLLSGSFSIHGRYLIPVLAPLIIFAVLGIQKYKKSIRSVLNVSVVTLWIIGLVTAYLTIYFHYYKAV